MIFNDGMVTLKSPSASVLTKGLKASALLFWGDQQAESMPSVLSVFPRLWQMERFSSHPNFITVQIPHQYPSNYVDFETIRFGLSSLLVFWHCPFIGIAHSFG
jgi:hypothetical protein